jgi:hypothetical protein
MESGPTDARVKRRRRMIFVLSACLGAINRLDPDELEELGLITRLQEVVEMVESDLEHLASQE